MIRPIRRLLLTIAFLAGAVPLFAQEVLNELQFNPVVMEKAHQPALFKAAGLDTIPVGLPFFDDFSSNSTFPSYDRWIDRTTFVTDTHQPRARRLEPGQFVKAVLRRRSGFGLNDCPQFCQLTVERQAAHVGAADGYADFCRVHFRSLLVVDLIFSIRHSGRDPESSHHQHR